MSKPKWPRKVWVQRYGRGEMYAHVSKKACRDEFGADFYMQLYVLQAAPKARKRKKPCSSG